MAGDPQRSSSRLLEASSLCVTYRPHSGPAVEAVRDVDLEILPGEAVGVLGESGCGKSTLARALLGLRAPGAEIRGRVLFEGKSLLDCSEADLERIRGDRISIVFQEPGLTLNPVRRVGSQVADVLRAHRSVSADEARQSTLELLDRVRLDDPGGVARAYPHQLSGGQRQRIAIAQALICEPALLIADEPTAALDTITQADLIELLAQLRRALGMATLLVSHDPQLLATFADRLVVMYAGRIVETGPLERLFDAPAHPYLSALLRSLPVGRRGERLPFIAGSPPSLSPAPAGCAFSERCPDRLERCSSESPTAEQLDDRRISCWNPHPSTATDVGGTQ